MSSVMMVYVGWMIVRGSRKSKALIKSIRPTQVGVMSNQTSRESGLCLVRPPVKQSSSQWQRCDWAWPSHDPSYQLYFFNCLPKSICPIPKLWKHREFRCTLIWRVHLVFSCLARLLLGLPPFYSRNQPSPIFRRCWIPSRTWQFTC